MSTQQINRDDMGFVYLGMILLLLGAGAFIWYTEHAKITYYCLKFSWHLLGLFDYSFSPDFIKTWRIEIAYLAANPAALGFKNLLSVVNKVGYLFVWIPIGLCIRQFFKASKHKANLTKRLVDIETLPKIMAKHAPAVIPILHYGDSKDLLLNVDPPEHRSALNPEEFVKEHALLQNGKLNREMCHKILAKDLGTKISTIQELSSHEKSLFSVFATRLFSDGKELSQAQKLLDDLNFSCNKHTWQGKKGYPDLSITNQTFKKYANHPDVQAWIEKHPYPRTLLYSMHKEAVKSGKLPSSNFRWLKGMDRGLWYALNTTGRKVPFIESAAVFCQASWEDFLQDAGYTIQEPVLDGAIDGIEQYLIKIGLISL